MCIAPVKILNPKLAWTPVDPKYIVVQCNNCYECRARRQQEWFVRSYYEWLRFKDIGSVFNFTLTFRNEDLPKYHDIRPFEYRRKYENGRPLLYRVLSENVDFSFQCFNQNYITRFFKLFRQNLVRQFPDIDSSGIKYICACEYGEKKHRPHHHVNLFVPFKLSVRDFRQIVCKSWTHGFVGASKKGFLVNSISALEYTTKYVSKDLYFFDEVLGNYLDKDNLHPVEYEHRRECIKEFLPKLRVSNGFGSGLCDSVLKRADSLDWILRDRPIELPSKNGKIRNFSIPRYVFQKLCKAVDKSISKYLDRPYLVYSEFGNKLRREQFDRRLEMDKIDLVKMSHTLESFRRGDDYQIKHAVDVFIHNFQKLNIDDFVLYRNFLRYIPVIDYGVHSASWFFNRSTAIVRRYFKQSALPDIDFSHYEYSPGDFGITVFRGFPLKDFDSREIVTLSDLPQFRQFELVTKCIDEIYKCRCFLRSKKRKIKDDDVKRTRQKFIDFCLYDLTNVFSANAEYV